MSKSSNLRQVYKSFAMLIAVAIAAPAWADEAALQTAPAPSAVPDAQSTQAAPGDIVVTARRREESLQNVPVAVTAFSENTLQQKSIYNPYDLNKAVPGLAVVPDQASGSLPEFDIRGRGNSYGAASGSVETYFADVPLSPPFEAPGLPPQFFDLQSVQVLKGPQGTLFGRNSTGGAVLFVPAAPTDTLSGYFRAQGGNYGDVQVEGAVNVPISDKVLLRVAGFKWRRTGYTKTLGGEVDAFGVQLPVQDYNNQDVTELRATLLLKLSSQLTNSTIVTYHTDQNRGSLAAQYYNFGLPGFAPTPASAVNPLLANPQLADSNVNLNRQPSSTWAVINTTTFEIDPDLTLKNIASHIQASGVTANPSDYDGSGSGPFASLESGEAQPRVNHNYQTTDELQLQGHAFDKKLDYIVGGLLDITRQPGSRSDINFFNNTYSIFNGATPFNEQFNQQNFTSESIFGSLTAHIADNLSFTAGARHTWDNIKQLSYNILEAAVVSTVPDSATPTREARKFSGWTYNAGLEYHPTTDTMVYGGYRHGYKRGGFNTQVAVPSQLYFAPETDDDFYAGIKQNLRVFGVPGHFNLEGFYDLYYGSQREFLTFTPTGLATVVVNAEKSTYRGFDMDFTLDPTKWLSLSGNYTFVDSKYNKFTDQSERDASGNLVPGSLAGNPISDVSRNKLSITARLHEDLPDGGEIAFAPTFSYQSKFFFDDYSVRQSNSTAADFLGGQQINEAALGLDTAPGYSTVDLRAEWNHIGGSRVDIGLNGNNILNKTYVLTGNTLYTFGVQAAIYGPPRMVTGEVRVHF